MSMSQIVSQGSSKMTKDTEIEMLRGNVNELQAQLQAAYQRIGELVDERDGLRCDMVEKIKK